MLSWRRESARRGEVSVGCLLLLRLLPPVKEEDQNEAAKKHDETSNDAKTDNQAKQRLRG